MRIMMEDSLARGMRKSGTATRRVEPRTPSGMIELMKEDHLPLTQEVHQPKIGIGREEHRHTTPMDVDTREYENFNFML
jgi:hypothetical protein